SDVAGVAAVSMDGIVLVSRMAPEVNADRVGAVAATITGVTRRVSTELRIGRPDETIIQAKDGLFMVLPVGEQSLLSVNLRKGANLGLVRLEARETVDALNRIL
ncbi:MAG: roadblock/LC7 domain-containing protein, partial [Chloroflexota bacterium]